MALYRNRLSESPRRNLGEIIPLETPFVVLIDPSSACNLRCKFCPTGFTSLIKSTGRYHGYMDLSLFKKIIDDLEEFTEPIETIRLYKEGEPLVSPHFCEMVKYAKQSDKVRKVDTITNGILLDKPLCDKIVDSGLDQINISVNGLSEEHYFKHTGVHFNFQKLVDAVSYLYSIKKDLTIYVKCIRENFTNSELIEFARIFEPIADYIFIENMQPNWPNFKIEYINPDYKAGHLGQPLKDRDVCPYIFYSMVVNADGTVSACVQDWQHKLIVGDVREQRLIDIWKGLPLLDLQLGHLRKGQACRESCSICPVLRHGCLDDIDAVRHEVEIKLSEKSARF